MNKPTDLIKVMPEEQKEHIIKKGTEFLGATSYDYDSGGNVKLNNNLYTIKDSSMRLAIYTFYEDTNNGHQRRMNRLHLVWQ